jgi:hypothetical protein
MVVTLVITMTNNNEQRTMNYSKQTQSNPILSASGGLVRLQRIQRAHLLGQAGKAVNERRRTKGEGREMMDDRKRRTEDGRWTTEGRRQRTNDRRTRKTATVF